MNQANVAALTNEERTTVWEEIESVSDGADDARSARLSGRDACA